MVRLNKTQFTGNPTKNIESKKVGNSVKAEFTLAQSYTVKTKEGVKDFVDFVSCEAWGKIAERLSKHVTTKTNILVDARLKSEHWQDNETQGNRSRIKLIVSNFQFNSPKPKEVAEVEDSHDGETEEQA